MRETPYVPVKELRAALDGLTLRQIRWDIRHGYLPGTIDHRNMPRVPRQELNDFLAGTWVPAKPVTEQPAAEPQPVSFLHRLPA